ncbi:MAG TPA: hypothetical protein VGO48_11450 [Conexibacter sp.]|jgi:hypothetical protein|nr:hypothetical protein [Conexibacter sp.]
MSEEHDLNGSSEGVLLQSPELSRFADRVASVLTDNPSMVALRNRLSEDLRRSVDLDQLTRRMQHDVAAGGVLSDLQSRLANDLRKQFAESPALRRFQSELSSSLRFDPSFTEAVHELLGPRAVPVDRWAPLLQTLRQRTGVDTDLVEQEMRSVSVEVEAADDDEANWLLRLTRSQRAALLLAASELAWAISQIAVVSTGNREASPQVQYGVQALLALIAVLVVLIAPDDDR